MTGLKDLLNEILKYQEDSVLISEGLLYTYPPSTIFSYLQHSLGFDKYQIQLIQEDEKIKSKYFEILILQRNLDNVEKLMKFMENICGWAPSIFISTFGTNLGKFTYSTFEKLYDELIENERSTFIIRFEAKFNISLDNKYLPDYLYHVSLNSNVKKILKIGIKPTSKSKISSHLDRIYLTLTLDDAYTLKSLFLKNYPQKEFAILKIDTKSLANNVIFFEDPMFQKFEKIGIYTLSNIPPTVIQLVKTT